MIRMFIVVAAIVLRCLTPTQSHAGDRALANEAARKVACFLSAEQRQVFQEMSEGWYLEHSCQFLRYRERDRFNLYYSEINSVLSGCKADLSEDIYRMQEAALSHASNASTRCDTVANVKIHKAFALAHTLYFDIRHARIISMR